MPTDQHTTIFRLRQPAWLISIAFVGVALLADRRSAFLHGEDRPREIPKDGSWIRYQHEVENLGKGQKYDAITTTLSFVGTVVEENQTCRWLEKTSVIPEGVKGTGTYVVKVLVPEKDFWESNTPFENVRRAWVLRPNEQAVELPARFLVTSINGDFLDLVLWTPGTLKASDLAAGESKDIEYQKGRLKGAEARTVKRDDKSSGSVRIARDVIAWQHLDLPIGAAEVKVTKSFFSNRQQQLRRTSTVYRIQDFGGDAKSMLPDNN